MGHFFVCRESQDISFHAGNRQDISFNARNRRTVLLMPGIDLEYEIGIAV